MQSATLDTLTSDPDEDKKNSKVIPIRQTRPTINEETRKAQLKAKYWGSKSKEQGDKLTGLRCPSCGHYEAYSYSPYLKLVCNRKNKCGIEHLYKEIFNIEPFTVRYSKQYPTKQPEHHRAKVYLRDRGFSDETINKLVAGEDYKEQDVTGEGPAILFRYNEPQVWNGRIFDPKNRKSHTIGKVGSTYWKLKKHDYTRKDPVYVTESPIKALALFQLGVQAVALASARVPDKEHSLFTDFEEFDLRAAFDADKAGRQALRKFSKIVDKEEGHIEPHLAGYDWDNYLIQSSTQQLSEIIEQCSNSAYISLATTAQEWAQRRLNIGDYLPPIIEFNLCTYECKVKEVKKENDEAKKEAVVTPLFEAVVSIDHFLKQTKEKSQCSEYLPVISILTRSNGTFGPLPVKGSELMDKPFRDLLLSKAKTVYLSNTVKPNITAHLYKGRKQNVEELETFGFHERTETIVLPGFAVGPNGNIHLANDKNFIPLSHGEALKPFQYKPSKLLSFDRKDATPDIEGLKAFVEEMIFAYGMKAIECLGWLGLSVISRAVKAEGYSVPFLFLIGKEGTGKTGLLKILNGLVGLNEEGASFGTGKGSERLLSQRSGLPVSLLEVNPQSGFKADKLLPCYDDNSTGTTANYSNDNKTKSYDMKGVPLLSANLLPTNQPNFLSRLILLDEFKKGEFTDESREAWRILEKTRSSPQMIQVCLAFFQICQKIRKNWGPVFEEIFEDYNRALKHEGEQHAARSAQNYALVAACGELLFKELELDQDARLICKEKLLQRVHALRNSTNLAEEAFEVMAKYLDPNFIDEDFNRREGAETVRKAVGILKGQVRIWIPEVLRGFSKLGYNFDTKQLRADLKNHPACIEESKAVKLPGSSTTTKCMVFKLSMTPFG
jgi:energy-coupling factor transporter ATP-binding protein EcfA2